MTGEGIAAIVASVTTLLVAIGNMILQFKQAKLSASNSVKLDVAASKIEEVHVQSASNSDKLDVAAGKIEEVHTSLVESTGSHPIVNG